MMRLPSFAIDDIYYVHQPIFLNFLDHSSNFSMSITFQFIDLQLQFSDIIICFISSLLSLDENIDGTSRFVISIILPILIVIVNHRWFYGIYLRLIEPRDLLINHENHREEFYLFFGLK